MNDLDAYRDDFLLEADEIIARLSSGVVQFEQQGHDPRVLAGLYRDLHTLKGISAMMSFQGPASLSHCCEDLLERLGDGSFPVTPEAVDVLLAAADQLSRMVEDIRKGGSGELDAHDVKARLRDLADSAVDGGESTADANGDDAGAENGGGRSSREPTGPRPGAGEGTVRVGVDRLDSLLDLVGEVVIGRNRILEMTKLLRRELGARELGDGDARGASPALDELAEIMGGFNRLVADLQESVLSIRMLPVSSVFRRFPRYVRDLARELDKQCEVVIEGEETELDRAVLELLKDPLVHIVRNAIDHGLESPEERLASGKPEQGQLRLSARSEEGSILIEIADDGRGIDVERLVETARGMGLIDAGAPAVPAGALQLVFAPGLSTAGLVSDLSGRGVGLDVVQAAIEALGGQIEVESEPGKGSSFLIKLPLTLAIMQVLKVGLGAETYGVPLPTIVETRRLAGDSLASVGGRRVMVLRDEVMPVINLTEVVSVAPGDVATDRASAPRYAVIVAFGGRRAALLVDRLDGQEEVVIKPLGAYLQGGCRWVGGATVLGDGQVTLILDIGALLDLTRKDEYLIVTRPE